MRNDQGVYRGWQQGELGNANVKQQELQRMWLRWEGRTEALGQEWVSTPRAQLQCKWRKSKSTREAKHKVESLGVVTV